MTDLKTFPGGGIAVVIGASGGLGSALFRPLARSSRFGQVVGLSRSAGSIDLTNEQSIATAAAAIKAIDMPLRLVLVATGLLHDDQLQPEKSWRHLDADRLARSFAVNATGPALIAKHFLPLLPREGKAVFAAISAKVGSIGDNRLGGWYGYRASKAALNQLVRTASVELARRSKEALCVALHPGTVATALSAPFSGSARHVHTPDEAARHLLAVIDGLPDNATSGFYDWRGDPVPW